MATGLIVSGAAIFVLLGVLHLLYTFLDLKNPKRFAPADKSLLEPMQKTTIRMRPDAKNYWLSTIGFHFSHSIGVLFYGAVTIFVALSHPELLSEVFVGTALIGVGVAYIILARSFWFVIPYAGALLGTILITAGVVAHSFL